MATPNYKGPNQPSPNGSGWLGSWLGGTPAYANVVTKPSAAQVGDMAGDGCAGPIAIVIPREVIEQQ